MSAIDNSFVNLKPMKFQHSKDDLQEQNTHWYCLVCGLNNIIKMFILGVLNVFKQLLKKWILKLLLINIK